MVVTVNGRPREVPAGTTLASVVADTVPAATGIAVAVDSDVVSRAVWGATPLREGARVEILTAMQGG